MDKIFIHNLVKNINDKKNKKEIVELLEKYLTYVYTKYYIYLDDYIKINVPNVYKSLDEDFIKSDKSYIKHNKGTINGSIKNIINTPAFFTKKPIGIYVGCNSCYHNAGMQIILRISGFLKFIVDNFEYLFNYCKRVVISNKLLKYQYGYLDFLLFISDCINNINCAKEINYSEGLSCKLIYANDVFIRNGITYPKRFGYQHDSSEFVMAVLTTFDNISDISKLFGFSETITKQYFIVTYDIVYTYNEGTNNDNIAEKILNSSVSDKSLNNVFYMIINNYVDSDRYNIDRVENTKEIIIQNQYFKELKLVRKSIRTPPDEISIIDHMSVLTNNNQVDLISILNSFTSVIYSNGNLIKVNGSSVTINSINSISVKKLKKTAKYLIIIPKGLNVTITKTKVRITNELQYDNKTFSFVGYIYHTGNLGGGHYQTRILVDNIFYNCSDSSVNPINSFINNIEDNVCMVLYEDKTIKDSIINLKPDNKIHNLEKFLSPFSEKINEYINS